MPKYKLISVNDLQDNCSCCGKQNLSKVAWLIDDNGEESHYGVVCASKLLSFNDRKKLNISCMKLSSIQMSVDALKLYEYDVNLYFVKLQDFFKLHCYDFKYIPTELLMLNDYFSKVLTYDGNSWTNPCKLNNFKELNYVDIDELILTAKDVLKN